ncbi:MAG: PAS domain-containing sensor histidine kinase, partial [Rubrivivax sp.]
MSAPPDPPRQTVATSRTRRALLWSALVALLLVAQTLLVALTLSYESSRAQEEADTTAAESAAEVKRELLRSTQSLQGLLWSEPPLQHWREAALALMRDKRELLRVERRERRMTVAEAVDTPLLSPLFRQMPRSDLDIEAQVACAAALRLSAPMFSRTYFVPQASGHGQEVIDLCIPLKDAGQEAGFLVGTLSLAQLLDNTLSPRQSRRHELSFVEGDGTRLARAG